jgi:hypothetical protein
LRTAGLDQVKLFSWNATARGTFATYERALASAPRRSRASV